MKQTPGFIALISVLILLALALVAGIGLAVRAIGENRIGSANETGIRAYVAANACAEYALIQLKNSLLYAGNELRYYDGDSCAILAVGGAGNLNRVVKTTSTVSGATRKILIQVDEVNPRMKISSWTDVVDF